MMIQTIKNYAGVKTREVLILWATLLKIMVRNTVLLLQEPISSNGINDIADGDGLTDVGKNDAIDKIDANDAKFSKETLKFDDPKLNEVLDVKKSSVFDVDVDAESDDDVDISKMPK